MSLNTSWWRRACVFAAITMLLSLSAIPAALATLSGGSTFESGDGDLAPNTSTPPAPHDWNSPVEPIACPSTIPGTGTNCGLDLVKNGADNSLGQGSKEDNPVPTVVTGSIPPSKDDLSRFYVNKERINGNDYLYLAWERSNLLGSAHMDFELSQDSTLSANGVTTVRTAGDLLIDFDFGGSGVPVLTKHTWITGAPNTAADCEASNTLPCWDKAVSLGAFAEAQVNSAPVVDNNPPGAPRTLDGNTKNGINSTFGEAGINLTGSGIFPPNVCEHFGAATLKSRSSGNSFTSELKDFIAPIPVDISNCGTVNIHKQDDLGAPLSGAVFTLFTDNAPVDGAPPHGGNDTATSFTCTTVANGNCSIGGVPFGNYWAVETTGVPNHDLAADQSFSLTQNTPNRTISLTFVDPRQPARVNIHKQDDASPPNALQGAVFTLYTDNAPIGGSRGAEDTATAFTCTTDAAGDCSITNILPLGDYWVVETTGVPNHDTAADQHVTLTANATVSLTFVDPRHRGAILVTKLRKHAADGSGDHPHAGVDFTVNGVTKTTDANGQACFDGLLFGSYSVHETTPSGYHGEADKTVTVDNKASCADNPYVGETVSFHNTPLTNITVSVDSQIDGGTSSTIDCVVASGSTGANGDGSVTASDLEPGTYVCTIVVDP